MLREAVARKVESHDRGFRWRSHEISRIEGLSDAVFAFAVTLLIVSLEVPRTFAELRETISGFLPFAISFAMLRLSAGPVLKDRYMLSSIELLNRCPMRSHTLLWTHSFGADPGKGRTRKLGKRRRRFGRLESGRLWALLTGKDQAGIAI